VKRDSSVADKAAATEHTLTNGSSATATGGKSSNKKNNRSETQATTATIPKRVTKPDEPAADHPPAVTSTPAAAPASDSAATAKSDSAKTAVAASRKVESKRSAKAAAKALAAASATSSAASTSPAAADATVSAEGAAAEPVQTHWVLEFTNAAATKSSKDDKRAKGASAARIKDTKPPPLPGAGEPLPRPSLVAKHSGTNASASPSTAEHATSTAPPFEGELSAKERKRKKRLEQERAKAEAAGDAMAAAAPNNSAAYPGARFIGRKGAIDSANNKSQGANAAAAGGAPGSAYSAYYGREQYQPYQHYQHNQYGARRLGKQYPRPRTNSAFGEPSSAPHVRSSFASRVVDTSPEWESGAPTGTAPTGGYGVGRGSTFVPSDRRFATHRGVALEQEHGGSSYAGRSQAHNAAQITAQYQDPFGAIAIGEIYHNTNTTNGNGNGTGAVSGLSMPYGIDAAGSGTTASTGISRRRSLSDGDKQAKNAAKQGASQRRQANAAAANKATYSGAQQQQQLYLQQQQLQLQQQQQLADQGGYHHHHHHHYRGREFGGTVMDLSPEEMHQYAAGASMHARAAGAEPYSPHFSPQMVASHSPTRQGYDLGSPSRLMGSIDQVVVDTAPYTADLVSAVGRASTYDPMANIWDSTGLPEYWRTARPPTHSLHRNGTNGAPAPPPIDHLAADPFAQYHRVQQQQQQQAPMHSTAAAARMAFGAEHAGGAGGGGGFGSGVGSLFSTLSPFAAAPSSGAIDPLVGGTYVESPPVPPFFAPASSPPWFIVPSPTMPINDLERSVASSSSSSSSSSTSGSSASASSSLFSSFSLGLPGVNLADQGSAVAPPSAPAPGNGVAAADAAAGSSNSTTTSSSGGPSSNPPTGDNSAYSLWR